MEKKSGKNMGSITQKADSQDVRISQVSNVSKAVSAMGKKTTQEMKETERRISSGGDSKAIAGSMNSVLGSLKKTVDALEKGVETATLGTAKAANDAIKQYGKAISDDIKINRQNMVASALASSTPIFGYFASKFMETGVFKKTTEKMRDSVSSIFKRKSKGGSMPDDFDMGGNGGGGGPRMSPAQAAAKQKQIQKTKKQDSLNNLKIQNRDRYEKYDKETENKTLLTLTAIQSAVGAQVGKFDQWYSKLLLQHPYFRTTMVAFKAISSIMGGLWKAVYFFWRPRGGYKKHLSKAKNPFTAMNQNIGALFVQSMPRLDAIMIYTKATAEAVRDMSNQITGKKYPKMDPSKLGGTWSIAGTTMKILKGAGRWLTGKMMSSTQKLKPGKRRSIQEEMIKAMYYTGQFGTYMLEGPGKLKKKLGSMLPGSKEKKRLFGGLGGVGVAEENAGPVLAPWMTGGGKLKKRKQLRAPKFFKGMGRKQKPDLITQGVYDLYKINSEKKRDKMFSKMQKYTAESAKAATQMNKRQKRKGIFGFLFKMLSMGAGFIGNLLSGAGRLFGRGGIASLVIGALLGGITLWDWLDKKFPDATLWKRIKDIMPQIDTTLAIKDGIMGGISRLFAGEDFNLMKVIKETFSGFLERKLGFSTGDWWKVITGKATPEEMMEMNEKMTKKVFGEDAEAIQVKAMRASQAKGAKAKTKAYLDLGWSAVKSVAGADVQESKLAITRLRAQKFVKKYGGRAEDYLDLTIEQAEALGKKIYKSAQSAKNKTVDFIKTITPEQVTELVSKYGGTAKEYAGKSYEQAKKYAMSTYGKAKEKAGEAKTWGSEKWKQFEQWSNDPKSAEEAKNFGKNILKKSGEYIELGKGNFVEIYRQGSSKLSEVWETSAPEKKAIMKRELEKLMLSGEVTVAELERMGIKLKDATMEAGEKVGNTVSSAAAYTTNTVSNAVNNVSNGGGGQNSKMLQEKTMDDIAMGEVLF